MAATKETVVLVYNPDGDLISAVRPVDALNPEITEMEILGLNADFQTEIMTVTSFAAFLQYEEEMAEMSAGLEQN